MPHGPAAALALQWQYSLLSMLCIAAAACVFFFLVKKTHTQHAPSCTLHILFSCLPAPTCLESRASAFPTNMLPILHASTRPGPGHRPLLNPHRFLSLSLPPSCGHVRIGAGFVYKAPPTRALQSLLPPSSAPLRALPPGLLHRRPLPPSLPPTVPTTPQFMASSRRSSCTWPIMCADKRENVRPHPHPHR